MVSNRYPRVSVIVACYDQATPLALTLDTLLRQELPHSLYEIIVVDDHSPDYSARRVVAGFRERYPEAALLYVRRHRVAGGLYGSSARVKNVGLRLARGEYVFFNNAEIAQAGESLSDILRSMEDAPGPLCLRGRVIDLPQEQLAGRTQAELEAMHDRADRGRERVATADHAGLAAVPRALLLAVGGNDERFDYWGKEDIDLAARLKRAGATYRYDENLKSFHLSHPPNHVKQGDYERMCALLAENQAAELVEANRGQLWGALDQPPRASLDGTVVVEADADAPDLTQRLEAVLYGPDAERYEALVACLETHRPAVEAVVGRRFRPLPVVSLAPDFPEEHAARVLRHVRTETAMFLPVGSSFGEPVWDVLPADAASLAAWAASARARAPRPIAGRPGEPTQRTREVF
jgi:glycosyltransferase involved in cell wall biosynthesis